MEKYRPLVKWILFAALFLYVASAIYGNLRFTFLPPKTAEVLSDVAIYGFMASVGLVLILSGAKLSAPTRAKSAMQENGKGKWSPGLLVLIGLGAFLLAIVTIVGGSFLELRYAVSGGLFGFVSAVLIFGGFIFVSQAIYLKLRN